MASNGTTQIDVEVQAVNIGDSPIDGTREANVVAVLIVPVGPQPQAPKKVMAQIAWLTPIEDAPRVADVYELTIRRKSTGKISLV
jgi:hypothetical protein